MLVLLVFLIIVLRKTYNKQKEVKTDLIFTNLEIELYFKDRKNILTFISYECIVNKEDYREFEKNIIWTGEKYNYTKIVESSGHYSLSDSNRKSSPYSYTVDFNKKLSIGDFLYFKLETSVYDGDLSMNPVFSHMIKNQTNKFIIKLTVPKNLVKNVRPKVYKDIGRTIEVPNDIDLKINNVGDYLQYSYSLNNPTLLNNYFIEWDFK